MEKQGESRNVQCAYTRAQQSKLCDVLSFQVANENANEIVNLSEREREHTEKENEEIIICIYIWRELKEWDQAL